MTDYKEELARAATEVSDENWVESPDYGGVVVQWLPLISAIDCSEWPQIGLGRKGVWVVVSHHGLRAYPEGKYPPTWLLALDYPLHELRKSVNDKGYDAGMASHVADLLPYEAILMQGLDYGNDPAMSLVLAWLEDDPSLVSIAIAAKLATISGDRRFAQSTRHRARKLPGVQTRKLH